MNYGYFRITRKGNSYESGINQLVKCYINEENIYYDFGIKDGNLSALIKCLRCTDSLHILRLNDLGTRICDVVEALELLSYHNVRLYICNREVFIPCTIMLLRSKMNFFINFDNYPELPAYMNNEFMKY